MVVGAFPGFFALTTSIACRRWGHKALLLAPIFWATLEWARLGITGQLWNAIGYSQAEVLSGLFIQPSRWGGVYAVGFLIASVNAAIAFAILRGTWRSIVVAASVIIGVVAVVAGSHLHKHSQSDNILSFLRHRHTTKRPNDSSQEYRRNQGTARTSSTAEHQWIEGAAHLTMFPVSSSGPSHL